MLVTLTHSPNFSESTAENTVQTSAKADHTGPNHSRLFSIDDLSDTAYLIFNENQHASTCTDKSLFCKTEA